MHIFNAATAAALLIIFTGCAKQPGEKTASLTFAETYAEIVHRNYQRSYETALELQTAVHAFLAAPDDQTLAAARQAWFAARKPYGQTEAFRFYEGPIDFADPDSGQEGPEGQLNAWPLNEAFIDFVEGDASAGLINKPGVPITREVLIERNGLDDEANVTTGYHAIEFLLWGQDLDADGPGDRSATDFIAGEADNDRRGQYLNVVTDLLVADLKTLMTAWAPGQSSNYRAEFLAMDSKAQIANVMTGLATLSGFELASERIAVALDSGDQEHEHSCFSDNTHNDIVYNAQGILNVCVGEYDTVGGTGLLKVVADADASLADKLEKGLQQTQALAQKLEQPFDKLLASSADSEARQTAELLVASLQAQSKLFVEAGGKLGVKVIVAAE